MPRPTKEQAQALRDKWLSPLTTYFQKFAGKSHTGFLHDPTLFRCINSANQGGKTQCMMADCVAKLLGKHPYLPNFSNRRILVIITRTDQAATIWGRRLLKACGLPGEVGKLPWIDRHYIKPNGIIWARSQKHGKYPGSIQLINGSEYFMALAGDPDSWQGLEGIQIDDIYQDEATGTENLMDELEPRLWFSRENNPGGGGKVWGATETKDNPAYQEFKKRCQSGLKNHAFHYFPWQENTSISAETRESAKNTMSAEAYAVRAMGVGSTIDKVKIYSPHWKPAVHEIADTYRIRPDDNLWIGFDPGWRDKCGILCGVVSRDQPRLLKVIRWYSYKFGGYDHAVQDMKAWLDGRTCTRLVCDAQIHATQQHNGRTYYMEFCQLLEAHKVLLHADPLWAKPRLEDSIPVVQDALDNHGERFDPYRNSVVCYTGDPSVNLFVGELLNYRWQVDREGNILRTTVQKNIESADVLRYVLFQNPTWMDYGQEQSLTQSVTSEPESEPDPDRALWKARMAEADRIWAEEGLEDGAPEQMSVIRW